MKHGLAASVSIRVSSVAKSLCGWSRGIVSANSLPPLVAGLLVACDPILLNQQSLVMTETLAAFLSILALWRLARFDGAPSWFQAALAGGAIGLAVLCRPTFLPWLALAALVMLAVSRNKTPFRSPGRTTTRFPDFGFRLANFAGLVLGAAAVLSPWATRNYRVFGRPIVTTTHGGYTFLLGNNESFFRHLLSDRWGLPWRADQYHFASAGDADFQYRAGDPTWELDQDRVFYHIACEHIRAAPVAFLSACVYRWGQLWSPLPHQLTAAESAARRALRYATCAWYCGVYLLVVMGIWKLRWKLLARPWLWGLLLCLAFMAVHTLYWTNLRMRAPLVPFVALVAAAAVIANGPRPAK